MEKESKFEIMTEDYWLVLTVCGNQLHVQVLIYACDKVGKFSSELSFSNENPLTFSFESPAQAIDFIKSGNNFEVDLTKKIFIMKWKVIGDRFQRNIIFPITLNNEKMTEVEELKCQNIILKRKLSALTKNTNDMPLEKNELKKKENEYFVKVQNKTPDQVMQKAVSDNKESIQIEISGSEFYKNKNSVIDNSENDETEQNKLKREKRKTIKKKEKKSIFQIIKAQKQKLSNLIPHQNPPKKRGRKKKCDQEAYKSYILNDNQIESTVSSANKVKISFANGDYYSGQILNNLYHGYGLYYSETNGKFQGNWENGRANGFGISVDPMGNRHSGFYIDDKRTGKGIDEYTNGEKYEGYFQEDCKSGLGKYIYQNGDFYEGFWKNDMYNGKGVQNYHDGSKYDGYWIDDQKDGEGIFITREGKKFLQVWIRGNKESEQQIY